MSVISNHSLTPWGRHHYSHFTDDEKSQRELVISSRYVAVAGLACALRPA